MTTLQQHLLIVQLLAVVAAFGGEFLGLETVVAVGFATFFAALAALFVQMTAALVTGLRRSDGTAMLH
jgi:hypothetical protein